MSTADYYRELMIGVLKEYYDSGNMGKDIRNLVSNHDNTSIFDALRRLKEDPCASETLKDFFPDMFDKNRTSSGPKIEEIFEGDITPDNQKLLEGLSGNPQKNRCPHEGNCALSGNYSSIIRSCLKN